MADHTTISSIAGEEVEIEKSYVSRTAHPAIPPKEFDEGDTVELGVLISGVRQSVKMKVVVAELRRGRWMYGLKRANGEIGQALHQDENGNAWFRDDQLELPRD